MPRLRRLAADAEAEAELECRRVESPEDAERERFLGSPTVRVDGRDVEPGAADRRDFGLKCRLYGSREVPEAAPRDDWIRVALRGR